MWLHLPLAPCTHTLRPPSAHPLPPSPAVFFDFLLFLWISSRFHYRVLPHATVSVEAATGDPNKSAVGLSFTMSQSERGGRWQRWWQWRQWW